MNARWWIRGAAVVFGLLFFGTMGGCYAGAFYNVSTTPIPVVAGMAMPLIVPAVAVPVAYGTTQAKHGPTAAFHNTSESRLAVRYWVGKVDCRAPGGVADWRSPAAFEIDPGDKMRVQLGRKGWYTANSDAVVRVQVSAVAPSDASVDQVVLMESGPYWYEFERPAPYFMKAVGPREALAFESYGEGGIKPVDRSLWFDRVNDDFPATNVAQLGAVWGDPG